MHFEGVVIKTFSTPLQLMTLGSMTRLSKGMCVTGRCRGKVQDGETARGKMVGKAKGTRTGTM